MDCILKSTKLIFNDLKWVQHFSSSRDSSVGRKHLAGAGCGAGPCANPRCPPPKRNGSWGSDEMGETTTKVGAEREQPPRDLMSMRQVKLFFTVALGPGNSVWQRLVCLPVAFPWLCLGTSLSFKKSPAACRRFTGGKGTLSDREESLQCDTSKNRHDTVNINNQTKMWLFEQTWKLFKNRNTKEITTYRFTISSLF